VLVRTVRPGALSSAPHELTVVGTTVFFAATANGGRELWKSNGTFAGTVRVKDINPGGGWSSPRNLTAVGTKLFFTASTPAAGRELWVSDGTAAGTRLAHDLFAGCRTFSSHPGFFTLARGVLLFRADDGVKGNEIWAVGGGATAQAFGRGCGAGRVPTLAATDPVLGRTMTLRGGDAAPNTAGVLMIGLPTPRPISLTPGCTVFFDLFAGAVPVVFRPGGATWSFGLPIPSAPGLLGAQAVLQVFLLPTAAPLGLDLTNGVHLRLGR